MAEIPTSLAVNQANFRQEVAISAIKQAAEADRAIVGLIDQVVDTGAQPLNSSGRGQIVNLFT